MLKFSSDPFEVLKFLAKHFNVEVFLEVFVKFCNLSDVLGPKNTSNKNFNEVFGEVFVKF